MPAVRKPLNPKKTMTFAQFQRSVEDYNVSYWVVVKQHKLFSTNTALVAMSVACAAYILPVAIKAAIKHSDPVMKALAAATALVSLILIAVALPFIYKRSRSLYRKANYMPATWTSGIQELSKLKEFMRVPLHQTDDVKFGKGIQKADAVRFLNTAATLEPTLLLSKEQRAVRARSQARLQLASDQAAKAADQASKPAPSSNSYGGYTEREFNTLSL